MTMLPQGVQFPLQVTKDGEPVILESARQLRQLRSFIDGWIGIYDKAEKLPQLSPSLPPTNAITPPVSDSSAPPTAPAPILVHTIDYILQALETLGDPLPIKAVYYHILTLGWTTDSPDLPKALQNLENTARKYKGMVKVEKGTIRLVKPG